MDTNYLRFHIIFIMKSWSILSGMGIDDVYSTHHHQHKIVDINAETIAVTAINELGHVQDLNLTLTLTRFSLIFS